MATKSANVTARVQPEIKRQAEAVLERIGLPVSVLIDTLYRQIIMTGGVPYSLTVPNLPARDSMTDEQFDVMMEKFEGISPLELKDLQSFVPMLARAFPNEFRNACEKYKKHKG